MWTGSQRETERKGAENLSVVFKLNHIEQRLGRMLNIEDLEIKDGRLTARISKELPQSPRGQRYC
jgi:hypothetical protein